MQMFMNGAVISADLQDSLTRAVIISLFSWRRADDGDDIESDVSKQGWWGDSFSTDRIGSKIWEILRQKLNDETIAKAQEYSRAALQWMIEDGLVTEINVEAERDSSDFNRLNLKVELISNSRTVYEFKEL